MTRDNTVTYVKAIGIILMVVGHVLTSDMVVRRAIFTFHMPLFFLMSGYCFKEKYLDDAKQFVLRKIKGIYVPYVLFALPFLALHNVFCKWHIYDPEWIYSWKDYLWEAGRIVTRMSQNESLIGTFWFLKELFFGNLIFYVTLKLIKRGMDILSRKGTIISEKRKFWKLENGNCRAEWVTAISLFVLTVVAFVFQLRIPYFGVNKTSAFAAFFIALGYLWKKSDWNTNKWWIWLIGIASIIAEAYLIKGTVAIDAQTPLSLLYYTSTAIFATMAVFEMSRWLDNSRKSIVNSLNRGLRFIGEHTLSVMALHFTAFKIVTFGYVKIVGLPIERMTDFPTMLEYANAGRGFVLYTFVGLFAPLVLAWLWLQIKAKISLNAEQNEQK